MASSMYAPLPLENRDFRLLFVKSSTDDSAPVTCELKRESLDNRHLNYKALSYTWGDARVKTPIFVNDVKTQITLNLEAALRHIRQPSCDVVLWTDALCINQEDTNEKNRQIQMMGEIYSRADLVIAWLGSADEDSNLAMEVLREGPKRWMEIIGMQYESVQEEELNLTSSTTTNDEESNDMPASGHKGDLMAPPAPGAASDLSNRRYSPGELTRLREQVGSRVLAIIKLLKRSWWSRIWVVQEVMLTQKVVFKCGDAEVSRNQMKTWEQNVLSSFHLLNGDHNGNISSAIKHIEALRDPTDEKENGMHCLLNYGRREATEPRDHIYGLLGLLDKEDRILLGKPNYYCRVEELFTDTAAKLMRKYKSLEFLQEAGRPTAITKTIFTHLDKHSPIPSWVPDWTLSWSIFKNGQTTDSGVGSFSEPVFQFSKDSRELTLEGFEFDVITSVQTVPATACGNAHMARCARDSWAGTHQR